MTDDNPYSSPLADSFPPELPVESTGVWQDNGLLVMRKKSALPDLCIKCSCPANGFRLKRNLSWHHPAWYLVLFLCNVLIYAIIALIVRQTAVVRVGLCELHRARRRTIILTGWLLALAGIAATSLALAAADVQGADDYTGLLGICGIFLILGGLVCAVICSRLTVAKRIDRDYLWLKRIHPDYLAQLPHFGSRMEGTVDDYSTAIDRPTAPSPQKATALYNRALTYAFEKKYHLALADLEALLAMPETPAALRAKAEEKREQFRKLVA